jgi:hypothetical protein
MNAEQTNYTYVFMYSQQNARINHSMKIFNKFFKMWQMQIFLKDTNQLQLYS